MLRAILPLAVTEQAGLSTDMMVIVASHVVQAKNDITFEFK